MKKNISKATKDDANHWSVKTYWNNRWNIFLILSLFMTTLGLFLHSFEYNTKHIDIIAFLAWFFGSAVVSWWGSTLSNSKIENKRYSNKFIMVLYNVSYYSPIYLSFFVLSGYYLWHDKYVFTQYPILWGVVFAVDLGFVLYRWTYRVLPNIFFAAAAFIFYTMIATFAFPENQIMNLGVIHEGNTKLLLTGEFTKWLGWGAVGLVISTFIGKAAEDIWIGFSRSGTGDYAKIDFRFKQQRRKLLSYVGGKNDTLKSFTKIGWISTSFLAIIVINGTLLIFKKSGDVQHILAIYFFGGIIFVIMGFIFHAFISDGNLMRAEKSYLVDRKAISFECMSNDNSHFPCGKIEWEWRCYCQVFINLYCSRSPIFFENDVLHNAAPVIVEIKEMCDKKVCPTRVLMDLVTYHNEQFPLYCGTEAKPEKDYIEAIFAGFVSDYIDYFGSQLPGEPVDFTKDTMLLQVIKKMFDKYFYIENRNGNCESLIEVENVPFYTVICLLKMDYLRALCIDRTANVCQVYWLCGKKCNGDCSDRYRPAITEEYRNGFPEKIQRLMKDRWGKDNLIPIGDSKTPNEAFAQMRNNYNKNWINEAKEYGVDDEKYWDESIFFAAEDA